MNGRRRRAAMLILLATQVLVTMEGPILNVSLATIQHATQMSTGELTWLVSGYVAAFGSLLLLGGRLVDVLGARLIVICGLVVFALSSLCCALTVDPLVLIGGRVAQGAGAAIVVPGVLGTVRDLYPQPDELRRAIAIMTTTTMSGSAVGLLVGGVIADLSAWQGIFWINVPIAAALALLCLLLPLGVRVREFVGVPLGQTVALVAGIGSVLVSLSLVPNAISHTLSGWLLALVGCIGMGCLLLLALMSRRTNGEPLVPTELFGQSRRLFVYLLVALTTGASQGTFFFLQLIVQDRFGFSPLRAGLAFVPVVIAMAITAPLSVRLMRVMADWGVLVLGVSLQAGGLAALTLVSGWAEYGALLIPMILVAGGGALCVVPLSHRAMSSLRRGTSGSAASVLVGVQQLGGAVVLTVMGADAALTKHAANPYLQPFLLASGVGAAAIVLSTAAWWRWGRSVEPELKFADSELEEVVTELVVGITVADQTATA